MFRLFLVPSRLMLLLLLLLLLLLAFRPACGAANYVVPYLPPGAVASTSPTNVKSTDTANVGWKGGICNCPDGTAHMVGANIAGGSYCESLACVGGFPGDCFALSYSKFRYTSRAPGSSISYAYYMYIVKEGSSSTSNAWRNKKVVCAPAAPVPMAHLGDLGNPSVFLPKYDGTPYTNGVGILFAKDGTYMTGARTKYALSGDVEINYSILKDQRCNNHWVTISEDHDYKMMGVKKNIDNSITFMWSCDTTYIFDVSGYIYGSCGAEQRRDGIKILIKENTATWTIPGCYGQRLLYGLSASTTNSKSVTASGIIVHCEMYSITSNTYAITLSPASFGRTSITLRRTDTSGGWPSTVLIACFKGDPLTRSLANIDTSKYWVHVGADPVRVKN